MLNPKRYSTANGPVYGLEADLHDVQPWNPTVAQLRDTVLGGWVVGTGGFLETVLPPAVLKLAPSQDEVEEMAESCHDAIRAGRLIDFGVWTNDVMKYGGKRGGPLYHQGAIGHPFRLPYVFMHSWEGVVIAYLVNPLEPDKTAGGDCEAVELQPVRLQNHAALMLSDRIYLETARNVGKQDWNKYHCAAIPSIWRYLGDDDISKAPNAAAGNVLDPLMTALLILSTRGIPRETVRADDKLQKARAKNGKPPIPPYERVISAPYVTAIQNRLARGRDISRGGTHASPVGHIRMGHSRTYASGVKTWVRDALVNMTDDAKRAWLGNRSHYEVKS
jgi:hypothetical protein